MAWNSERVQQLEKLWQAGLSASQIARKMGDGVTRNAVIGKVHRMGFSERGQPPRIASSGSRKPSSARASGESAARRSARGVAVVAAKPAVRIPQLRPAEKNIRILDLADHLCRWPMGDPQDSNFRFCGAPQNDS